MIQVDSLSPAYQGVVRNGSHAVVSDAPITKGGGGMGFGAHELLEAALAACLNMAVRMHADQKDIPLEHVATKVTLSWPDEQTSKFEYRVDLTGPMSPGQRAELQAIADSCPVRRTLSRQLVFERAR
jgi:putative redox protein